jgi:hypothetical protein
VSDGLHACLLRQQIGRRAPSTHPWRVVWWPPPGVLRRNAPHYSRFTHVPSLEGRGGFWDTVRGWGLGMCQVCERGKQTRMLQL